VGCDSGQFIFPGALSVDLAVTRTGRDLGGQVSSGELRAGICALFKSAGILGRPRIGQRQKIGGLDI
jgi:hypothetical protein